MIKMVITSVKKTRRNNISVFVDGEYFSSFDSAIWFSSGLSAGSEVCQEKLDDLLDKSNRAVANRKALSLLSGKSYTERQLTEKLALKAGYNAAANTVSRMKELGYVDDADYARRYAKDLYKMKCYASRRISYELQKRGIAKEIISDILSSYEKADDEARALSLVETRFGIFESDADIRRAAALLERYGYSTDVIHSVIKSFDREVE